jgi:NarL family two-component system response regulator LiaR
VGVELEKIQKWLQKPENLRTPLPQNENHPNLDKIRVLIVDDHAVVRQGLRTFIDLQEDMTVVAEGGDGLEGVDLATRLQPDIVLLDLVMPNMDGIEATRQIHECSPNSKILILTSFGEDDKVFPAIRHGALGYLLKDIHPNDLVKAVRSANQGQVQLHPDIAKKLMDSVSSPVKSVPVIASVKKNLTAEIDLTDREKEVISCIARGLNNREIAREMVISEKTVKTHVSNLLSKLAVDDRTQAAIWAIKNGLGS